MADIELVIKIPEEMMSYINGNEFNAISEAAYGSMTMLAIQNGTPLPKGHGDLIDRNEVEKLDDKLCAMECAYCTLKHCFYHEARPIIKADKESEK